MAVLVRGLEQVVHDAGLLGAVARVWDQHELGLRPLAVQRIRRRAGAHDIVAALHDGGGDVADLVHVFLGQQRAVGEPATVREVVRLDASEGERPLPVSPRQGVLPHTSTSSPRAIASRST